MFTVIHPLLNGTEVVTFKYDCRASCKGHCLGKVRTNKNVTPIFFNGLNFVLYLKDLN